MTKRLGQLDIIDLTKLLRSFTSVYQLLPTYPCFDSGNGSLQRVAESNDIPNLDVTRARLALQFHREIESAVDANWRKEKYLRHGYSIHPIVGTDQPTLLSARKVSGKVELIRSLPGDLIAGDGTVPRVSATPLELSEKNREFFVAETHGSLQSFIPVLTQLQGLLASNSINWDKYRDPMPQKVTLMINDAYSVDEQVLIRAYCATEWTKLVVSVERVETGEQIFRGQMKKAEGESHQAEMPLLKAGTYRVRIGVSDDVPSVTDVFIVD